MARIDPQCLTRRNKVRYFRSSTMTKRFLLTTAISIALTSSYAVADLQVQFIEGAPKDRFVITNVGDCALEASQFGIDFANSKAGLIFDVTNKGAGVEVYQPFEVTTGAQFLVSQPLISDGDQSAVLNISGLGANETIAFTIDVDDTLGTRAITVTDSELSGSTFSLSVGGTTYAAVVETEASVMLATPGCGT